MVCGQCPPYVSLSNNWNSANGTNSPNWVSWELNKSWLGNLTRRDEYPGFGGVRVIPDYPPNDLYSATKLIANSPIQGFLVSDYPWVSDQTLPDGWIKTESPDYKASYLQRGHLVASSDRNRNQKDNLATFLTSNLIPQHKFNNTVESAWYRFERYTNQTLVADDNKELQIVAGTYSYPASSQVGWPDKFISNNQLYKDGVLQIDSNGRPIQASNLPRRPVLENGNPVFDGNGKQVTEPVPGYSLQYTVNAKEILVPEWTWKIAVILDPGQGIADITSATQVLAILTPNRSRNKDNPTAIRMPDGTIRTISKDDWGKWETWRVSARYIEQLTGLNFLSNIPQAIQDIIEVDNTSNPLPNVYVEPNLTTLIDNSEEDISAPLLAEQDSLLLRPIFFNNTFIDSRDSIVGGFPVVSPTQNSFIINYNSFNVSTSKIDIDQSSSDETSIFQDSSLKISSSQVRFTQIGTAQVGANENSPREISIGNLGTTEIGIPKVNIFSTNAIQISPAQIRSTKISPSQIGLTEDRLSKVSSTQVNFLQVDPAQIQSTKISLPSSVTSQQLFSGNLSHDNTSLLTSIYSTAQSIWHSNTSIELNFAITNLPTGQLAEATITGYDTNGRPNAATISIDTDANGIGWFIDSTPGDNSEFTGTDNYFQATTNSPAAGKYDLLTAILHEMGHTLGFINGYSQFNQNIKGRQFYTDPTHSYTLSSDFSHLDNTLYPHDLLNTNLKPGVRKLPSTMDWAIINAINSGVGSWVSGVGTVNPAHLNAGALIGITNGDFTTPTTWNTEGATNIINGTATLTEQSQKLSSLTQAFIIPTGAKTLQFTIKDNHLVSGDTTKTANDAFEVALLDTNTFNPLAGTSIGLNHTDSLLNIQANGTIFHSDKVTITALGNNSSIVTIDLTQVTPSTQATLYFNLLGFGARTSTVTIDDVKLFTDTQPIPITKNDTLITNQNTPLTLDLTQLTTNDTNVSQIQIINQPTHGTLTQTPDGKFTYTPIPTYVGNDSFTYLGFSPDGQISNLATVNLTVNNLPPTIETLTIPTTIKEGQLIQLSALAKDGGSSDNLTYTWNLGDGSNPITGRNIAYAYTDNGNYDVVLTVTDKDGGSTERTTNVKVDNVAPTVAITAPTTSLNQGETLNLGVNYSDPGIKDTHTITWNFDDGSTPITGVTNPSHTFTKAGTNNVTVTITDNDGASTTKAIQIAVTNVAPTITNVNIPTNINEGQPITLTATKTLSGGHCPLTPFLI